MRVAYLTEKDAAEESLGSVVLAQCAVLAARGHQVLVVTMGGQPAWAPPGVEWHKVERLVSAPVLELLAGCDAVVATHHSHVAVATDVGTAAPFLFVSFDASPVNGLAARAKLIEALRGAPVAVLTTSGLVASYIGGAGGGGPVYVCAVNGAGVHGGPLELDGETLERALLRGLAWHRSRVPRTSTLGLAMIVRDEEENVRQCLATVKPVVDEMVVVDTGSRDNTVAVAEQMGAKVVKQEWRDDFAEARNVSLEHLSTDWVLVLDADERLAQSSQSAIRRAILNPVVDAFLVDIINVTGEVLISGALAHSSARLFRRRPEYRYEGYLHEQIAPCIARTGGHVRPLPGASILHYGYLGAVVAARDKSERNMAIVRRQVEEDPRNGFAHFNLGMEYVRRGDRQRAIKAFQRSFRLLPGLNVSYAPVLLKNLAACLLEDQRHEEALALLELGEQVYPDYVDLALLRGIGLNRSRRYREALTVLEACVEKGEAPAFYMTQVGAGSFLARMAMVESYLGLGRFDEAAESYRLAAREMVERLGGAVASALAKHAPGAAALWETAEHRVENGDIAGAVKAYRQLMDPEVRRELLPTQLVPLWQRKTLLEVLAGDLDAAYEDIRLLQGINANAAEACRLLVDVVAESDSTGDKVLPLAGNGGGAADPAHPGHVGSRLSWHDVAVPLTTLLDAGREMWFARACEWLASGPVEEAELDLELGKLLFQRGWYDAAARHLLASVRAGATDAVALGQMGELAARGGLPADARAFYRQAIRLSPKVPRYWVSLAASYHAAGNDRAGLRVLDLARRCTGGEIIEATRMALEISSRLRSDGQHARGPACGSFSGGWHP